MLAWKSDQVKKDELCHHVSTAAILQNDCCHCNGNLLWLNKLQIALSGLYLKLAFAAGELKVQMES